LPYNVKAKSRSKDSRWVDHSFKVGENYLSKARAFMEELSEAPFSKDTAFAVTVKKSQPQVVSLFSWLDQIFSLEAPGQDFKDFLERSEGASFEKSNTKLNRINKGQFAEDRVEMALNILIDNGVIDYYERFQQHSKNDQAGEDFCLRGRDFEFAIDVKAGKNGSSNENRLTNVQHKDMSELVADLTELCELAS
jgi:hypothetical protein